MARPSTFLQPDDALAAVLETVRRRPIEEVALEEASGRVLAVPVDARLAQPRFDKAAVDGFGVRDDHGDGPFTVVATIAAGDTVEPERAAGIGPNESVRIMTGAVVPSDVGRVVRLEYTETASDGRVSIVRTEEPRNIAYRGENIEPGDTLLSPRRLAPIDIGILASQGYQNVPVVARPRVAVLSTGSELRTLDHTHIEPYAIYDGNSYQLVALARSALADATSYGILADTQSGITAAIRDAVARFDVVITSGGVSMGDLDLVPAALEEVGAKTVFHGLALKPGRPTLFATFGETLVFGLPGNPVSTFTQFELLIAPALLRMHGLEYQPREAELPLATPYVRTKADRHEYLPGHYRDGHVHRVEYMGSGDVSAYAAADCIFRVDRGVQEVRAGETVYVRFIRSHDRLSSDFGNR
jgi:molybdopterin molybdotransferase